MTEALPYPAGLCFSGLELVDSIFPIDAEYNSWYRYTTNYNTDTRAFIPLNMLEQRGENENTHSICHRWL